MAYIRDIFEIGSLLKKEALVKINGISFVVLSCRNGSVGPLNSSLDTSKDDSFTDIDVESVDKETGGSSTSSGATPSLDRPPLNNVTTNVNNGGSASAAQNGSLTAGSNGTAAPGQSAVPPTTAAAALINSEKEEVDAKDWTPYFLGEMPLAQV